MIIQMNLYTTCEVCKYIYLAMNMVVSRYLNYQCHLFVCTDIEIGFELDAYTFPEPMFSFETFSTIRVIKGSITERTLEYTIVVSSSAPPGVDVALQSTSDSDNDFAVAGRSEQEITRQFIPDDQSQIVEIDIFQDGILESLEAFRMTIESAATGFPRYELGITIPESTTVFIEDSFGEWITCCVVVWSIYQRVGIEGFHLIR